MGRVLLSLDEDTHPEENVCVLLTFIPLDLVTEPGLTEPGLRLLASKPLCFPGVEIAYLPSRAFWCDPLTGFFLFFSFTSYSISWFGTEAWAVYA